MNLLGISCYFHDAAAALVVDGEVVAAAEEERFSRRKHDDSFPLRAIRFCLERQRLAPSDLDAICFYEKPVRKLERSLLIARHWQACSTDLLRRQLQRLASEELVFEQVLERHLGYRGPVLYCEHHLSHAASAFFASSFEESAILTLDGVGEWATTARYLGQGTRIQPLGEIHYPHSLGLLYTTLTAFLGFQANSDEYKVMGLAAYGEATYLEPMRRLIQVFDDGSFRLDLDYFSFPYRDDSMHTPALEELLGPPRPRHAPITERHRNLAASLQKILEEVVVGLAHRLQSETGSSRLCLAGGVALNGLANWRILERTPFEDVFIQPAAGDSGGAVGAALLAFHARGGARRRKGYSTLLGPEFSDEEIESMLAARGASYRRLDEEELLLRTAELIHSDQIVGWFQGRMEFGPRSLGCRSLLANPCNPAMKELINSRVKFREDFRPFAPAVPLEHAGELFEIDRPSPYMLLIPRVRPGVERLIPAVVHADGSARLQTVDRRVQPRFCALIEAFGRLSGVPVLLNTSFNVQGEPIVCTPDDAYSCFQRTDIDALVMSNYLVDKVI